jgi:predicted nuclease of predicted toxin-antitoxin system
MSVIMFDECVDRLITVPAFAPHATIEHSRDFAPAAIDEVVLALARGRDVMLVTEDVGFGRLVFQKRLPPPPGIILINLAPMPQSARPAWLRQSAVEAIARAAGAFVTVGPTRLRARRFPPA